MNELWKYVPGYEGYYQVSNMGHVRSVDRILVYKNGIKHQCKGQALKLYENKGGYLYVLLYKDGVSKTKTVHRLVCETFLANPYDLPQINHKDENKHNNQLDNLEYCTAEQNVNYGTRIRRVSKKHLKPVIQLTVKGMFVKRWSGIIEASKKLGIAHSDISKCCKGKAKTTGGYCWKYA